MNPDDFKNCMMALIAIIIWIITCYVGYTITDLRKENKEHLKEIRHLKSVIRKINKQEVHDISDLKYSQELMDTIHRLTAEIVVIKFTAYKNTHELKMMTRQNMIKLITDIASTVQKSIDYAHIDFVRSLYSKEFLEYYIVQTSITLANNMLDNETKNRIYGGE